MTRSSACAYAPSLRSRPASRADRARAGHRVYQTRSASRRMRSALSGGPASADRSGSNASSGSPPISTNRTPGISQPQTMPCPGARRIERVLEEVPAEAEEQCRPGEQDETGVDAADGGALPAHQRHRTRTARRCPGSSPAGLLRDSAGSMSYGPPSAQKPPMSITARMPGRRSVRRRGQTGDADRVEQHVAEVEARLASSFIAPDRNHHALDGR